ncbi:helix-turn-helix domain-containing protein [Roseomonas terrae]|uniref:Helix-turn-helix domain-containing protein n=1 Tax=Neoroseomonas terrae TaxID=424799 RepID=A0ABS5EG32_9PROT|nr:helix-turn-helix domain-containing protein [Neoroseomonas terrae]
MLSVAAIAERLDVCERTVRRLIQAGHLKPLRVGRCLRISEEDLQTYMAGCR